MFRIIIAKLCISFCMVFYAYSVYRSQPVFNGYKTRVGYNLNELELFKIQNVDSSPSLVSLLMHNYFSYFVLIYLASSFIIVFTKKQIYKLVPITSYLLFFFMNQHPKHRFQSVDRTMISQIACIVGGMLYLMGIDKQGKKKLILTQRQFEQLKQKKLF